MTTTPDPGRLREIATMCDQGADADPRLIDCLVWAELGWTQGLDEEVAWKRHLPLSPHAVVNGTTMHEALVRYPQDVEGIGRSWNVPFLSTSQDAAETILGEPEFPFVWSTTCDFGGLRRAHVFDGETATVDRDGETLVLALLGAALEAIALRIEAASPIPERR